MTARSHTRLRRRNTERLRELRYRTEQKKQRRAKRRAKTVAEQPLHHAPRIPHARGSEARDPREGGLVKNPFDSYAKQLLKSAQGVERVTHLFQTPQQREDAKARAEAKRQRRAMRNRTYDR